MKRAATRSGEFERIARHFAPLAASYPGAFELKDDAALRSEAFRAGAGGSITIRASELDLTGPAIVNVESFSTGAAGAIRVESRRIV